MASDATSSQALRDTFRLHDLSGNGYLERVELQAMLEDLCGGSLTSSDVSRIMQEVDRNGDGLIEIDEFIDWVSKPADTSLGSAVFVYNEFLLPIFRAFDHDETGFIEREEFMQVHGLMREALRRHWEQAAHPEGHEILTLNDAAESFSRADTDGDHHLSFPEFASIFTPFLARSEMPPETLVMFGKRFGQLIRSINRYDTFKKQGQATACDDHVLDELMKNLAEQHKLFFGERPPEESALFTWTEPPETMSMKTARLTYCQLFPLQVAGPRSEQIIFEQMVVPHVPNVNEPESRVWVARLTRKAVQNGEPLQDGPEVCMWYEACSGSWQLVPAEEENCFEDALQGLEPEIQLYCCLKTHFNFQKQNKWRQIERALEDAIAFGCLTKEAMDQYIQHLQTLALGALKKKGKLDEAASDEHKERLAKKSLLRIVLRPGQVLTTLNKLGLISVDPRYCDLLATG